MRAIRVFITLRPCVCVKCFEFYLRAHACQHTPAPTFASSFLTDSLHSPVLFPPFSLTHTRLIIYVLPRKPSDSRCFHGILNSVCRRINCTPTLSFILFFFLHTWEVTHSSNKPLHPSAPLHFHPSPPFFSQTLAVMMIPCEPTPPQELF